MTDSLMAEYVDSPALLVRKSDLTQHFSADNQLLRAVEFLVTGEGDIITDLHNQQRLNYRTETPPSGTRKLMLMPVAER